MSKDNKDEVFLVDALDVNLDVLAEVSVMKCALCMCVCVCTYASMHTQTPEEEFAE